jgi:hypothetical protein
MRRQHDDTADKIAALAGLSPPVGDVGNIGRQAPPWNMKNQS